MRKEAPDDHLILNSRSHLFSCSMPGWWTPKTWLITGVSKGSNQGRNAPILNVNHFRHTAFALMTKLFARRQEKAVALVGEVKTGNLCAAMA